MSTEQMENHKINPRLKANPLSKIFFLYTLNLFVKGFKNGFNSHQDLYKVNPDFDSQTLGQHLETSYLKHTEESLLKFLWKNFGRRYVMINLTQILNITICVASPEIVARIISYYTTDQNAINDTEVIFYGSLLIVMSYIRSVYVHNFGFWASAIAIKIKTALVSFIYRRTLLVHGVEADEKLLGKITTVITSDLQNLEKFIEFFTTMWSDLVKIVVMIFVLHQGIGSLLWVPLVLILIFTIFLVFGGFFIYKAVIKQNYYTEKRLELSKEALSENKIIKIFCWEKYFADKLSLKRRKECNNYYKMFLLYGFLLTNSMIIYRLCIILTLFIGSWYNYGLNSTMIYFIINCFNIMGVPFQITFPIIIYWAANFQTSLKRTTQLLRQLNKNQRTEIIENSRSTKPRICIKNMSLNFKDNKQIFDGVSVDIKNGLTIIRGATATGKSVLLKTILGFYHPSEGTIKVEGMISYASQKATLFPGTIRDNIIFNEEFNEKRYNQIIELTALKYDLTLIRNGDSALIADNGINLSTGQKARINLARALYKDADIYLIDDCLSCLDVFISKKIFKKCLLEFLKDKVVLLVASRKSYCDSADSLLEILNKKLYLRKIIKKTEMKSIPEEIVISKSLDEEHNFDFTEESALMSKSDENREEFKESANVNWSVYYNTIKLGIDWKSLFIIPSFLLAQFCVGYTDQYLNTWLYLENQLLNGSTSLNFTEIAEINYEKKQFCVIYILLIVALGIFTFLRGVFMYNFFRVISINLHNKVVSTIMRAEFKFFNMTGLGNILNRLSADLFVLDKILAETTFGNIRLFLELIGILIIISIVNVSFLIPSAALCAILMILRMICLQSSRDIKRLSLTTRSSMIGVLTSTIDGLATIRAFKAENKMKKSFDLYQNNYTSASYMYITCIRAFTLISDLCTTTFISLVISRFAFWKIDISAEDVGLAISQSVGTTSLLYFWLLLLAECENAMTSAERLLEYTNIKTEGTSGVEIKDFPKRGELRYEHVFLKYQEDSDYVLKDLNFTIKPCEKVGIVGRTGSGKSSIISALFRLCEIEGKIFIDDIDHKTLSLTHLRSKISMLPQDSFIFDATVRENIDPLGKYTDESIWSVLHKTELNSIFSSLDQKLNSDIILSIGQAQLVSLARILIGGSKIVIFDEASENLDSEMSLKLKTILENYSSCTIISIAHKLNFVLTSDRILVLDDGKIVEFDTTKNLLSNRDSLFFKMVQEDGAYL